MAKIENCTNCGRMIGELEQAYVFNNKIVCDSCNSCLEPAKRTNNPELVAMELRRQSLAYAVRISEPLPTLKKLDTLASRYNVAHKGAGGYGLEFAKNLEGYEKVANSLKKTYLEKFEVIVAQLIVKADETAQKRKTQKAKINVWQKTKEEILRGFNEFKYDLQGLKERVDYFIRQIDTEVENINQGNNSRIVIRYQNTMD